MADVKWIKLMVGMFDGASFKKIKRAKLKDGTNYRDKLTAVWFELLDLAGKKNQKGLLCDSVNEIPFTSEAQFEDIAIMIDREPEEVECCIAWFIKCGMITIVDDVYALANWEKYQAEDKLAQIREQNRIRQKTYYDKQKALKNTNTDVSLTLGITSSNALDKDIDIEEDIDNNSITNINITNTCELVSLKPNENAVISLPLVSKNYFNIYQNDIDYYQDLYPAVQVLIELKQMKGWLDSNPSKRKTEKGIKAFITRWLGNKQDKAPRVQIDNNIRDGFEGFETL